MSEQSNHFLKILKPWVFMSWILTCGIGLGSWWAYYELGWGGFWFGILWKMPHFYHG